MTLKGYVQVLRQFFAWAAAEGLLDANPTAELRPLRVPPVQVQAFSADEVRAMLRTAQTSRHALRDVAILTLLYDTGIRASELTSLTVGAVDLESGWCQVQGKGGKVRSVPLGRAARRALLRYVSSARPDPALPSDAHFFLNQTRHPLTRSGLYRLVRQTCERAGIQGKRLSPHTLRHAAAEDFIRNGGGAFELQRLLGHTTLTMTRQYVDLVATDVANAHRHASPADNLTR